MEKEFCRKIELKDFYNIRCMINSNKYSIGYISYLYGVEYKLILMIAENKKYEDVEAFMNNSAYQYVDMGMDSTLTNKDKHILYETHNCNGCAFCKKDKSKEYIYCSQYNCDMLLNSLFGDCKDRVNEYNDYESDVCMQEFHSKNIDTAIEKFLHGDIY